MISSEVQRTLVKSPPELWAEVSDPESLARHLGEFGEIRITRVQPEQKVEWEADDVSGTVVIKPSGWGTKVKLTVTREVALDGGDEAQREPDDTPVSEAAAERADDEHVDAAEPAESTVPDAVAGRPPEPIAEAAAEPPAEIVAEPTAEVASEPAAEEPQQSDEPRQSIDDESKPEPIAVREPAPEPRRGFFARLFGRRDKPVRPAPEPLAPQAPDDAEPTTAPEPTVQAGRDMQAGPAAQAGPDAHAEPERLGEHAPVADPPPPPVAAPADDDAEDRPDARDLAAELKAAEEAVAAEVAAVLTSVLDRLGAAHHRPFSRP